MDDFFIGLSRTDAVDVLDLPMDEEDVPTFKRRRGRPKKNPTPDQQLLRAEDVAEELRVVIAKGLRAYLRIGDQLNEKKDQLSHGEFGRLFEDHPDPIADPLPLKTRQAQRYMKTAKDWRVRTYIASLPSDLETVGILTQLSNEAFKAGIESGAIHDALTRTQARKLFGKPIRTRSSSPASTSTVTPTTKTNTSVQVEARQPLRLPYHDSVIEKKVRLLFWALLDELKTDQERLSMKNELLILLSGI